MPIEPDGMLYTVKIILAFSVTKYALQVKITTQWYLQNIYKQLTKYK